MKFDHLKNLKFNDFIETKTVASNWVDPKKEVPLFEDVVGIESPSGIIKKIENCSMIRHSYKYPIYKGLLHYFIREVFTLASRNKKPNPKKGNSLNDVDDHLYEM